MCTRSPRHGRRRRRAVLPDQSFRVRSAVGERARRQIRRTGGRTDDGVTGQSESEGRISWFVIASIIPPYLCSADDGERERATERARAVHSKFAAAAPCAPPRATIWRRHIRQGPLKPAAATLYYKTPKAPESEAATVFISLCARGTLYYVKNVRILSYAE